MQHHTLTLERPTDRFDQKRPMTAAHAVDRWVTEQMFEEDLRAVLRMMRPHGRERLMGWKEYRTGGADFRVTVSWDEPFEPAEPEPLTVPRMADVIEALLIGSAKNQDELSPQEEFGHYRAVVAELSRRIDEMESCYT
jgi:hypothetical protein